MERVGDGEFARQLIFGVTSVAQRCVHCHELRQTIMVGDHRS